MSTHYLDTLFHQIPECLHPSSFAYFNARALDLNRLLTEAEPTGTITLLMDHLATRTVYSTYTESETARKNEKTKLESAGYLQKTEIHYAPWKRTVIYGHGPSLVSPDDYALMIANVKQDKPSTYASLFSTIYNLDLIPNLEWSSVGTLLSLKDLFLVLCNPALPIEIKAVFWHQANGAVNHIALTVPSLIDAQPLLCPFSVQYTLNQIQIGDALNQQSTWDSGNDYIELVERHVKEGMIHRHEFKVENTEPLFRSTALGVLRAYCDLAEKFGHVATLDQLLATFPDAKDSIAFLIDAHLLSVD